MFFMPAMPAMGMAAERAAAALSAKGQGIYEGPLELDSGGTWQVTVTVQRDGANHRNQAAQPSMPREGCDDPANDCMVRAQPVSGFHRRHSARGCRRVVLRRVPLDALPDISDVQVIIHTDWAGEPPNIIEDQVTYPIVTALLAAPHVKDVRAQTMFGDSYVFVVFEDGTDLYWARSRVLEYLQQIAGQLADGRASGDRPRRHRRGLGVRVRCRGSHAQAQPRRSAHACRTGICATSWRPFRAWPKSPPSADSCASTRSISIRDKLLAYGIPLSTVIDRVRAQHQRSRAATCSKWAAPNT